MLDLYIASIILEQVGTIQTKLESPDWTEIIGDHLTDEEKFHLLASPQPPLLSSRQLKTLFGKLRADELLALSPVMPEINYLGHRRCVYVDDDSTRCMRYSQMPCCEQHYHFARQLAPAVFKATSLKEIHRKHLMSPRKIQLDNELALMRTMQELMLNKFKDLDADKIPLELMGAITTMSEKIGGVVEKMSKMNQITPETIDSMMDKVVDLVGEYLPADKLREFADKVKLIRPETASCSVPYEPGDMVMINDSDVNITTVHQRALIDIESMTA